MSNLTPLPRSQWRPQPLVVPKPSKKPGTAITPAPPQRIPIPPPPQRIPIPPPPQSPPPKTTPTPPATTPAAKPKPEPLGNTGVFAGLLRAPRPEIEKPEFAQRRPTQLANPAVTPFASLPDFAVPESPGAYSPSPINRPDLPPLLPPQIGRASPVPPPMSIETH